jgi:methyl-accepting chemotaxis protein
MDCALRLLKSEEHGEGAEVEVGRWLSLPDYIRAYEEQLNAVTERMMRFSTVTRVVDEYEQKMRRRMIQVDELLDELRAMARQTSKLALESSVLAGNDSSSAGQSTVVSLTDKIRAISEDTHELTRRIRHILEGIKEQLTATLRAMRTCAEETQREAYQAKIEVAQLNLTMLEKTKEVRAALEQIGGLGKEIRADIGRIIVAMQFQDITQQKLERVHQPVLDRVIQELRTVAEASHAIRDDAVEPQRALRRAPPAERASASPPATGEGNKVEFF